MVNFVNIDLLNNGNYLKLLKAISKLSGLFSDNSIPYINYRVVENIFCRSFNAINLSRSDGAFDANYKSVGIGLKTFIIAKDNSTEKIAEFNSLSNDLKIFKGNDLAYKLGEYRNERINFAQRLYGINESLYHIVGRKENELILFDTDYNYINIEKISNIKETKSSIQFYDGANLYTYNFSKSTLYRKFITPSNAFKLPIEILDDPFSLLINLLNENNLNIAEDNLIKGQNYMILPLYSTKSTNKEVPLKSGLNQWNASGRKRNPDEVYIPIPAFIHHLNIDFFPKRDKPFNLKVPTGEILNAKVCQDGSKALMTNPNSALSDWLLRKVLQLKEGELATIEHLNKLGFDSVIIKKNDNENFEIDIMKTDSYEEFIQ